MKAALALIFFACVAGSMASDARGQIVDQLLQQGQGMIQSVIGQLQQTVLGLVAQVVGQLSSLVGTIGGRFDFADIFNNFKPILEQLAGAALGQLIGGLSGLIGGARIDIAGIFADFYAQISGSITGLGQHFLNQGLAAVLGSLGSRGLADLFAQLSAQVGAAVGVAQGAISGIVGGLTAVGGQLLDASKPHWAQLQEQLVGHGLNVLGSLSETVNNLHGSITGGR